MVSNDVKIVIIGITVIVCVVLVLGGILFLYQLALEKAYEDEQAFCEGEDGIPYSLNGCLIDNGEGYEKYAVIEAKNKFVLVKE